MGVIQWVVAVLALATEQYVPRSLDETVITLKLGKYLQNVSGKESTRTCDALSQVLKSEVQFPNSPAYNDNKASYWAQEQSTLSPACFVQVTGQKSIAVAVATSRVTGCPFSVRSGGHSDVPGASNIDCGIALDLRLLNKMTLSADRKVASVGAGALWGEVYDQLGQMNLTVIGSRVSGVGVGGLTLGGGISYFSGKEGLACDNVLNYQVVTADARVLDVNQTSYPDFYFALRGGGNNFGIVIRFDLDVYEQGPMWGGIRTYELGAKSDMTKGFEASVKNAAEDPNFSIIINVAYAYGMFLPTVIVDYALPHPNPEQSNPAMLTLNFAGLGSFEPLSDSTRMTSLSNLTKDIAATQPVGFRNQFTTVIYKISAELQNIIIDIYVKKVNEVKGLISDSTGFLPGLDFQPLTVPMMSKFAKRGGNALGLKPSEGPPMITQFNWQWHSAADDAIVLPAIESIRTQSNGAAKEMGLFHEFVYMNYAAPGQMPISGYGAENVQKLRDVQRKYDPEKVFEKLQPGGFKLGGQ